MYLISSLFFFALIFEYFYINEDILFIISFAIFFYNVVSVTAGFLTVELESRKTTITELIKLNISLNKSILVLNLFLFDFLSAQDFEKDLSLLSFVSSNTVNFSRIADAAGNDDLNIVSEYVFAENLNDSMFELYALEHFE